MKKTMLLLATLLIGGMIFTSCSKDPTPTPTPTPTPEPSSKTVKVSYQFVKENAGVVLSDCFKLNVTYIDASGKEVTENGVTMPWVKEFEVTKPFHAKMEGELVYNDNELPDTVYFGTCCGIGYYQSSELNISLQGGFGVGSKEKFLNTMDHNPDKLKFKVEKDF